MRRVLLISAYDGPSHRYWREGLVRQFADWQWTVLTLPPRYFSWRIRGNALSLAHLHGDALRQPHDLLIVTSMVDLATLRGLVPLLGVIPTLWYCHENQFAYPQTQHAHRSIEPQMVLLYGALAADRLAFNSDYNRDTFMNGVDALLRKMPDAVPKGITNTLREKSIVLPVPLHDDAFYSRESKRQKDDPLWIVWNHRWEHDKGPDRLLALVKILAQRASATPLWFSIVGAQFRTQPDEFLQIEKVIRAQPAWQLKHFGFCAADEYKSLLRSADVVLSTALHDFQGLSVLEAVAAGCIPCVPDRLAYRQFINDEFRYDESDDVVHEAQIAADKLLAMAAQRRQAQSLVAPRVEWLRWSRMQPSYTRWFLHSTNSAPFDFAQGTESSAG